MGGKIGEQVAQDTNAFHHEQHRKCQQLQNHLHRNISFHLTTLYIGTWNFATMSTLCKTTRNVGAFVEVSYL